MEHQLTAGDLLRLAGGIAYWRGQFSALEGLARGLKVTENTLYARVLGSKLFHTRLQLAPPFENRCSCPKGKNCSHVVTLGLTFLHQERQKSGDQQFPPEERCYYLVTMLDHMDLRGLAMELLAAVPGGTPVAMKYLDRPGYFREWDAYVLDPDYEED